MQRCTVVAAASNNLGEYNAVEATFRGVSADGAAAVAVTSESESIIPSTFWKKAAKAIERQLEGLAF